MWLVNMVDYLERSFQLCSTILLNEQAQKKIQSCLLLLLLNLFIYLFCKIKHIPSTKGCISRIKQAFVSLFVPVSMFTTLEQIMTMLDSCFDESYVYHSRNESIKAG